MSDSNRLTFGEASEELGISESELEKLVAAGRIASIKDGDTLFFKREAVENYKNQEAEPAVLLSDEEINLLEDDEDIDFGIDLGEGVEAAPAAAAADGETDELSLDAGADLPGFGSGDATDPEETVVNISGVLEDEGTTPLEGDDSGLLEDTEPGLGEDTLLDTDVLDLGADDSATDTFDLDTAEETLLDPTEEGTLLRGGGARVMQMKRKKSHAVWTALLAGACVILLLPMSVLLSTIYVETLQGDALTSGRQSFQWIEDYGKFFRGPTEGASKVFH